MGIRPDFTLERVRELKKLGVCDDQIVELRKALVTVRHFLVKLPSNNDTRDVLVNVEKLSSSLLAKLISIALQIDPEYEKAGSLIEKSYWQQRPDDDGHTAMVHLIPRLRALKEAAHYGLDQIPAAQPIRQRSADPAPVERIHSALIYGWSIACADGPSYGRGTRCEESESAATIQQKDGPQRPKYPKGLEPSVSPGCDFRTVVGICYEAVGGNPDPEQAIKRYLRQRKTSRAESVDAMMKLWDA